MWAHHVPVASLWHVLSSPSSYGTSAQEGASDFGPVFWSGPIDQMFLQESIQRAWVLGVGAGATFASMCPSKHRPNTDSMCWVKCFGVGCVEYSIGGTRRLRMRACSLPGSLPGNECVGVQGHVIKIFCRRKSGTAWRARSNFSWLFVAATVKHD